MRPLHESLHGHTPLLLEVKKPAEGERTQLGTYDVLRHQELGSEGTRLCLDVFVLVLGVHYEMAELVGATVQLKPRHHCRGGPGDEPSHTPSTDAGPRARRARGARCQNR